jgi:hypothetical protein
MFDTWVDGDFTCMFLPCCCRLSIGLSVFLLAVLSIQGYKVTVNTSHVCVSSQTTWCDTVATDGGVWIVAAIFVVPAALLKYMFKL